MIGVHDNLKATWRPHPLAVHGLSERIDIGCAGLADGLRPHPEADEGHFRRIICCRVSLPGEIPHTLMMRRSPPTCHAGSLLGLAKSKQRTAIAVAAGFVLTHVAPDVTSGVMLLPVGVIDPFSKIEPDHRVSGAMSLGLGFIAKRTQWRGERICPTARDDQRRQQTGDVRK